MNHLTEEDLILNYYREPAEPAAARAHLAECGPCRAAAEALARTLDLCDEYQVPEPLPGFERIVWSQLESARRRIIPRIWLGLAAAAILLMAAFLLGRESRPIRPSITAGLSVGARRRILEISLADHLDRADRVLTEISNDGDLAAERGRAQDLVEEGRLLRQTLAREGDSSTLNTLDEVERWMLEAAHSQDGGELQRRIGSQGLLFKVRIIESNLRTQGQKS